MFDELVAQPCYRNDDPNISKELHMNQSWLAVICHNTGKLIRVTTELGKASNTQAVVADSVIEKVFTKNAKSAIRMACENFMVKATQGCLDDHKL